MSDATKEESAPTPEQQTEIDGKWTEERALKELHDWSNYMALPLWNSDGAKFYVERAVRVLTEKFNAALDAKDEQLATYRRYAQRVGSACKTGTATAEQMALNQAGLAEMTNMTAQQARIIGELRRRLDAAMSIAVSRSENMNLSDSECEQIATILSRRANEIAMFIGDNRDKLPASVDYALELEIKRLRYLERKIRPAERIDEDEVARVEKLLSGEI